jgi:DNA-binding NarL/FixJ family response regulator
MSEVLSVLTPRELELAKAVAEGLGNRQIGARLFLSENTVKAYLNRVFRKLGISSRLQLALMMHAEGK